MMMDATERAARSLGQSSDPIHRLVRRIVEREVGRAGVLVDVGCGTGGLSRSLAGVYDRYVGCDLVRYPGYPDALEWMKADLNQEPYPVPEGIADVVACVETIEHLENPRLLFRELVRLAKPGGLVIITTPNQLSALSKLSLLLRNRFPAFSDGNYPAHITALVEVDLVRMAQERALERVRVEYTDSGRIPGTARHWPSPLGGRTFSDTVAVVGRKPAS